MSRKKFELQDLKRLVHTIFERQGLSPEAAADMAEVMLASDRMGIESHGIQRIGVYLNGLKSGRINPKGEPKVIRQTPISAVIDACDGPGQPAAIKAMNLAIEKARAVGMGMVTVRNSNHFGIGGYYSLMAAEAGFLGICMTNSEAMVVPTFGRHPMMGTNPIAVSMPAHPTFFHFDISTSVVPAGKVEVYARNHKPLPEGWVVDRTGTVCTDAEVFLKIRKEKTDGGLLPLGGFGLTSGGHKGYALSMLVELMTGVLAGGCTSNHVRETPNVDRCCHNFWAIDYGMFGDKKEIEEQFSDYLLDIRESDKADGHDRIFIQGELEFEARRRVDFEGAPLGDGTIEELTNLCAAHGLDPASYLVEKHVDRASRRMFVAPGNK